MSSSPDSVPDFGNVVGSTTVTTVYARSHGQSVEQPIPFYDAQAERTWAALAENLGEQRLLGLSLKDRASVVGTVLRSLEFDRVCGQFLAANPNG